IEPDTGCGSRCSRNSHYREVARIKVGPRNLSIGQGNATRQASRQGRLCESRGRNVIRRRYRARLYAVVGSSADEEGGSTADHGFVIQLIGSSQPRSKSEFVAIEKVIVAAARRPIGDSAQASAILRIWHAGVEVIVTAILFLPGG